MNGYTCINGTMTCRYCNQTRSCDDYPKNTTSPRGHTLRCKNCTRNKIRADRGYKAPQKHIPYRPCAWCGTSFKGCKYTTIYCSRQCKADAAKRPAASTIYVGRCANCNQAFTARQKRMCCSRQCTNRLHYIQTFTPVQPRPATCIDCGRAYTQRHGRNTRCPQCVQARVNTLHTKHKAQRRAHETAALEPIDRNAIYERDNWTCYICHQPVDKDASNNHPRQPTLDHVWPLSLGGTHTMDNLRLACRACNTRKGADFLVAPQAKQKIKPGAAAFSGNVQTS